MNNFKDVAFFVLVIAAMCVMWYLGYTLGRTLERRKHLALEGATVSEYFPVIVDPERIAQLMAHRACIGVEHDPANGKLHGYCVVCGVPWPCGYAGKVPAATQEQPAGSARDLARQICDRRGPETVAEQVERATRLIGETLGDCERDFNPHKKSPACRHWKALALTGSPRKVGEDGEPAWKTAMRQFMSANIRYRKALDIIAFGPTSAADGYDLQGDVAERFRALAREAIAGPSSVPVGEQKH